VLLPIAAVGFGGGYLIGKPSSDTPKSPSQLSAPATFQLSKSQPSIAALGAPSRYPPLVRVRTHTATPTTGGGSGPGTTAPPNTYVPPATTTSSKPPPLPPPSTTNAVTTS
jgi:hypothetical protein